MLHCHVAQGAIVEQSANLIWYLKLITVGYLADR